MRRSLMFTALLDLEPVEFGRLEQAPRDLAGAVISAAAAAIPILHPDQYQACREWLATLMPADREPGWLKRFAELVMAAHHQNALTATTTASIETVWRLQVAFMLAIEINTGLKHSDGSILAHIQNTGVSDKSTKRAALQDIVSQIRRFWPEYTPSPTIALALRPPAPRQATA